LDIRVQVLNFDPFIPQRDSQRVHTVFGWNDPRALAEGYRQAVDEASGGFIRYEIVDWQDLDVFPPKVDSFQYTPEAFVTCWEDRETCHDPDGIDYPRMLDDYGVPRRIDDGSIDELWIFGAPYFGFWESSMAGPGAFYINGGVFDSVAVRHPFVIMGFSYERGVAEMLHNLCHRTEATMERIYGGWESDQLTTNWARFAANAHQSNGTSGVGSCHYPPNGTEDYDYANPDTVLSNAASWLSYPELPGQPVPASREDWGGPDYHLNYMRWWFAHLPHTPGTNADGRLNNWWPYLFDFNNYTAEGQPLP
jgi:hypothetical protein